MNPVARFLLGACVLLIAAPASPAPPVSASGAVRAVRPAWTRSVAPTTELRVLAGHAQVATSSRITSLVAHSAPAAIIGAAHVELGIRSEVSVRWRALSSLTIKGKASFSFDTVADAPLDPRLSIHFLNSAELELRRGSLDVSLPQAWAVSMGRSALSIVELAGGRLELVHRGGQPVAIVDRLGDDSGRSAPAWLRSGERTSLDAIPHRPRR